MIVKKINLNEFIEEFKQYNRDYFSYEGYEALYYELDNLSEDIGEPIELDVIAIACEYTEYESIEEFNSDTYSDYSLDELKNETTVLEFDGGIIVQVF